MSDGYRETFCLQCSRNWMEDPCSYEHKEKRDLLILEALQKKLDQENAIAKRIAALESALKVAEDAMIYTVAIYAGRLIMQQASPLSVLQKALAQIAALKRKEGE